VAEQIIIEFIGDASKLAPAIDVLENLGQIDAKAAQSFRNSNAELAKRETTLKKVTAEEHKQVKTLKDVEKAMDSLANSFIEGFQEGIVDSLAEAGVSVKDFEKSLKGLSNQTDTAASSQDSLKKQLREMTAQLAQLEVQEKRNTKEYAELVDQAGKVKDAIADAGDAISNAGSDTKGLDNLISLAGGVAGGFAVAQGGMALFGDESEEMQKTLLKVNAAMAILQGLQQIQDLMSKRQFASLSALIGLQRVQVIQTNLQTAAESKNVVVRWIAVKAQTALNAVMAANPIFLVIGAIAAMSAALAYFSDGAEKAKEKQNELNKSILEGKKANLDYIQNINNQTEEIELANVEAIGKSEKDKYDIKLKYAKQNLKLQEDYINQNLKLMNIDDIDAAENKRSDLKQKLKLIELEEIARVRKEREKNDKEAADKAKDNAKKAADEAKKARENELKSELAFAEAKAMLATDYKTELTTRRNVLNAKRALDLNAENLTAGEKYKINIEYYKNLANLDKEVAIDEYKNKVMYTESKLNYAEKGSQREYYLKKELIKQNQEVELREAELSITNKAELLNKKILIESKYFNQLRELNKETERKIVEDSINIRLSAVNSQLADLQTASVSETNGEVLSLKKQAIDEQAALDVTAAKNEIVNAELLAAKLKEIKAKSNADKRALDEANYNSQLQFSTDITNIEFENEKKRLQLQLAGTDATLAQRIAARKRIKQIAKDQLDEEYYQNELKLQSEEEYLKKKAELESKYLDLEIQTAQEKQARKNEIINAGFDVLKQVADAYFEAEQAQIQARLDTELKRIDEQKTKELENANLTEQQKADINAKYREKERAIRRKAAEDEKQAKITQALINGALAITNILATMPKFDFGVATALAIGASIASTGIAVAKIKSTPIPAFKTGTKNAPAGYALVGEEGPEIVKLKGGEKIYKYADSMRIADAWRGGMAASADEILTMGGKLPIVNSEAISNTYVNSRGDLHIDYNKLGKAVASQLPKPVVNNIMMDENGFTKYILDSGNKTNIKNERYTFK
jgi:hypothetical protein